MRILDLGGVRWRREEMTIVGKIKKDRRTKVSVQ